MTDEREIRDNNFSLLGRTRRHTDGRVELREPDGSLLGSYDERRNETRDPGGRFIGRGDQLSRLLRR